MVEDFVSGECVKEGAEPKASQTVQKFFTPSLPFPLEYKTLNYEFINEAWNWESGVGHCSERNPNRGYYESDTPTVFDQTKEKIVRVNIKADKRKPVWDSSVGYLSTVYGTEYQISFSGNKVDLCTEWKNFALAILIENTHPIKNKNEIMGKGDKTFITLLTFVNCGSGCSYGTTHTFGFLNTKPKILFYMKPVNHLDEQHFELGYAKFPPPRFLERLNPANRKSFNPIYSTE